jgi:hypothetical protein
MSLGGGAEVAEFAFAGGGGVEAKGHGESLTGWDGLSFGQFRFRGQTRANSSGITVRIGDTFHRLNCARKPIAAALRRAFDKGRAGCLRFSFPESISFGKAPV